MTATATAAQKYEATALLGVDGNHEEDIDEDKNQTAPIELLSEFLSALMLRDYETAFVHCTTILQYEPENQTAVEFFPLLQQRITEDDNDSLDDQDMASSKTNDVEGDEDSEDNSWSSSSSKSSDDDYSTASNTFWTANAVTDLDSPDKDEDGNEQLGFTDEDDSTDDVLNAALNQNTKLVWNGLKIWSSKTIYVNFRYIL